MNIRESIIVMHNENIHENFNHLILHTKLDQEIIGINQNISKFFELFQQKSIIKFNMRASKIINSRHIHTTKKQSLTFEELTVKRYHGFLTSKETHRGLELGETLETI